MVANSIEQMEKNVSASFGYVKKDILMVNDAISNVHDKIQHLSLNQAMLLEKMIAIEKLLSGKKTVVKAPKKVKAKKELKFYDVKTKEDFTTSDYVVKKIKGRKFAVAKSPKGNKSFRIMGSVKKSSKVKATKKTKKSSRSPKKVITETVLYE